MKLACVVHRFGTDIAGGSEGHCRLIAEHLAAQHDVTILTTCAKDHITWANHYPPGESTINGVRVLRFPVARERSMHRFMDLSDRVVVLDHGIKIADGTPEGVKGNQAVIDAYLGVAH